MVCFTESGQVGILFIEVAVDEKGLYCRNTNA